MAAASAGCSPCVDVLLARGADPARRDQIDKSAATYSAAEGHIAILKALMATGVKADERDAHQVSLLMWAAGYGRTELVRFLLGAGAQPHLRDDRGKDAATIALEQGHGALAAELREAH
jgi:hypothetical protein